MVASRSCAGGRTPSTRLRGSVLGGVRWALAIVLAGAAVLAIARPMTAYASEPPATLIDMDILAGGLYQADGFQQAALAELEQQALAKTLSDHGLPAGDATAVQTWGRDAALGELWTLLVQALETPAGERTATQEDAVNWLTAVMRRHNTEAADDASTEYAKWAGVGASKLKQDIAEGASESTLQGLLSRAPVPYGAGMEEETKPSRNNEGYCVYVSPSEPSSYSDNNYSSTLPPQVCHTECTNFLFGCPPPAPSEQEFVAWGQEDAVGSVIEGPSWATVANDVGETLDYSAASAAIGGGSGEGSQFDLVLRDTSLAAAAQTFTLATVETAVAITNATVSAISGGLSALDIASFAGTVVGLAAAGFLHTFNEIHAAELPGELAQLIADAPGTVPEMTGTEALGTLYALFVGVTLPEPQNPPCVPVLPIGEEPPTICLNPPPVPALSGDDPTFTITGSEASSSTTSQTLKWKDSAQDTTNEAYVSGNWFVTKETALSDNSTQTYQALDIHYTDWSGNEKLAWIVGDAQNGYQFVTATPNGSEAIDSDTCIGEGTCAESTSLQYVGTDEHRYTAAPPGATGIPPRPGCTGAPPCLGTVTSIGASPSAAEAGRPVTLTIKTNQGCGPLIGGGEACLEAPAGTVEVDDIDGSTHTTVCSGVAEVVSVATCTWTPSSVGTHELYATFTPDAEAGDNAGSQTETTVSVNAGWLTSTTVTSFPTTPALNEEVTYAATVADVYPVDSGGDYEDFLLHNTVLGGTVTFVNGSTVLCSERAIAEGFDSEGRFTYKARCATRYDQIGRQAVTATYTPDARHLGSSGSEAVTVPPGPTTIHVSAPAQAYAGVPFWFSLDVSAAGVQSEAIDGTATISGPFGLGFCTVGLSYGHGSCETTYPLVAEPIFEVKYAEPYDNSNTATAGATVLVSPAALEVTVSGSQVYGSASPDLSYAGKAPSGETVAGAVTCTGLNEGRALGGSLAVGSYSVEGSTCGGLSLEGPFFFLFSLSYAGAAGGFVVTPAPLTITAASATMTSGDAVPTVSPTYEGFVNSDSGSSLSTAPTCSTTARSDSPPGVYPTSCSGAADGNYDFTYVNGALTVLPPHPATTTPSTTPSTTSSTGGGALGFGVAKPKAPRPKVTGLTPRSGRRSGATVVIIRGNYFRGVTKVRFGSRRASFKVISAHEIRAILPRGAGTVQVSITTAAGTSPSTRADRFTYVSRRRSGR